MINDIRLAIADKLKMLYPNCTIYIEEVPPNFMEPSFQIMVTNLEYIKLIGSRYKCVLSFDISYFSDKDQADINEDCYSVQLELMRSFDMVGSYRIQNKQATITTDENILHLNFDVFVSEIKNENAILMQKQHTNTNI